MITCLHGLGFWHWFVDLLMLIPFLGIPILWIKSFRKAPNRDSELQFEVQGDFIRPKQPWTLRAPGKCECIYPDIPSARVSSGPEMVCGECKKPVHGS